MSRQIAIIGAATMAMQAMIRAEMPDADIVFAETTEEFAKERDVVFDDTQRLMDNMPEMPDRLRFARDLGPLEDRALAELAVDTRKLKKLEKYLQPIHRPQGEHNKRKPKSDSLKRLLAGKNKLR